MHETYGDFFPTKHMSIHFIKSNNQMYRPDIACIVTILKHTHNQRYKQKMNIFVMSP